MSGVRAYADLGSLREDDRIALIGTAVSDRAGLAEANISAVIGFMVENDDKADRYISKLQLAFPGVRIVDRGPGPVAGTILVRVAGP